jgi:hypothetical protein
MKSWRPAGGRSSVLPLFALEYSLAVYFVSRPEKTKSIDEPHK